MIRVFVVTSFLVLSLQARENPFFPSQGEQDLPYTSNENKIIPKLSRVSISLPSNARLIKKVTVEYENLDASIETKSIDLEHKVDWHLPIFISQSYSKIQDTTPRAMRKSKANSMKHYVRVAKIKYASFLVLGTSLKIKTQDSLIRHFLLAQPHRIVMDFKRKSSLKSYTKEINNSSFTKVRVGNHNGYYRVVVELDGHYRYRLEKTSSGCLIKLG